MTHDEGPQLTECKEPTILLLLLACADPPPPTDCGPGEIRLASSGHIYASLGDAIADAELQDSVCVGAGDFPLFDSRTCGPSVRVPDRHLSVRGAGRAQTHLIGTLAARDADCDDLALGALGESSISLSDLTLEQATVNLDAGDVVLQNLLITNAPSFHGNILNVEAETLTVGQVELHNNGLSSGGGFVLRGAGEITDLSITGARTVNGYIGELYGPILWTGGQISDIRRTEDTEGFDVLETWNEVMLRDITFADNRTNGPLITDHGALTLVNVRFEDNDVRWRGALSSEGDTTMLGGAFLRNTTPSGAASLWGDGSLRLQQVEFADNGACSVGFDADCILEDSGSSVTFDCDSAGCR